MRKGNGLGKKGGNEREKAEYGTRKKMTLKKKRRDEERREWRGRCTRM